MEKRLDLVLDPRKSDKVTIYIVSNKKEFDSFLRNSFGIKKDKDGAAIFLPFDHIHKNSIGIMVFNRENLDFFLVLHEVFHAVFHYLLLLNKNIYQNKYEEYLAYIMQSLMARFVKKIKIKRISNFNYGMTFIKFAASRLKF